MNKPLDLGPLDDPVDPDVERRMAERSELLRLAAVRALELHRTAGHLDARQVAEYRHIAGWKPIHGELGDGTPREGPHEATGAASSTAKPLPQPDADSSPCSAFKSVVCYKLEEA